MAILHTSYIMNEGGTLFVQQQVQCLSCGEKGEGFINMAIVGTDDMIQGAACPLCDKQALKITTFDMG